jgi:hypothetical protein
MSDQLKKRLTLRRRIRTLAVAILCAIAAASLCAPGASADPGDGPGGPILVVTGSTSGDHFGSYYAEILRAEGLNEFAVTDKANLTAATLSGYQVVLLAETSVTPAQVAVLTSWVQNGGNLIAMRPDAQLAGLLGLGADTGDLANAYMQIATGSPPGAGITAETMQFHDTADLRSAADTTTVATLRSTATTTASSGPAVTLRSVGPAGGQAAAFTYDLARSIVATRQGNAAWVGQDRDSALEPDGVIRSDDLFFPNWVDFTKVGIPQADEQQRLLANLITQMNVDRTPLPRFWYLPRGEKAAVVMTGDDHDQGGTIGQFQTFKAASPAGCSVANWECIRATSYIYPDTPITNTQAAAFQAEGFEIALHLSTGCANFTPGSLADEWDLQLPEFQTGWPSLTKPRTNRTHCIAWSDWAGEPKAELDNGVRFDTNYYYWPGGWVNDRPGVFTGSGFPMRFADTDGSLIDVYQAATQIPDESNLTIATHINFLLDRALDSHGYYGVFTANMHTDLSSHPGADAIVASAKARNVPVVSAAQMLDWLDGRNGSSFQNLSFAGGRLAFTVARDARAGGLEGMLPQSAATGQLAQLRRNGVPVSVGGRTVKGVDYAVFDAAPGDYVAAYGPGDATPPDTTIGGTTVAGSSVHITFSANEAGARFECRLDAGAFGACASPADYGGLADGFHTFSVRAIDLAGNVDPTPETRTFSTAAAINAAGGPSSTAGGGQGATTTPGANSARDKSAPHVTIVKRTVRASAKGLVTLRVTCPRSELRCRVELRLRRGKRELVRKTMTVAGGKSANFKLRLTRSDRLRLVRVRTLLVDAAATARDVAGNHATTTTRVRLLAPSRQLNGRVR